MSENWAFRFHDYGGPESVRRDEIAVPELGDDQVLVEVAAAGINPVDRRWRSGFFSKLTPLELPTQLGAELSGTVVAIGADVSTFTTGDRVMGLAPMRSFSRFAAVDQQSLCHTPFALSDVEAAALPVATLMAAQMLDLGALRAGAHMLVHGAAGGVGGFAVQLAKRSGATVTATASASSASHVLALGANAVIDYAADAFEDLVSDLDLVIDLVGGPVFDRSLGVLRPSGVIVSAVEFAAEAKARATGRRGVFHRVQPDSDLMERLAQDVARGDLRSTIAEVCEADGLDAAIERVGTGHAPGKFVVRFAATHGDRPEIGERSSGSPSVSVPASAETVL